MVPQSDSSLHSNVSNGSPLVDTPLIIHASAIRNSYLDSPKHDPHSPVVGYIPTRPSEHALTEHSMADDDICEAGGDVEGDDHRPNCPHCGDSSGTASSTPQNIQIALNKNQNKLIHLDPVPNFEDKADIKPWLQKIFYPQGIEIVIERSDHTKVIFKCKASKRGRKSQLPGFTMRHAQFGAECNDNLLVRDPTGPTGPARPSTEEGCDAENKQKKKRSVSRFNVCPFRVRATYSLKRKKWNIVVLNNTHSHDLVFNPDSEEYKKFKEKLRIDNDVEAIKRFDELEYRKRANLPIQTPMIPCDCGLTSEIQSFNIVLPTTAGADSNGPYNIGGAGKRTTTVNNIMTPLEGSSSPIVTTGASNMPTTNNNIVKKRKPARRPPPRVQRQRETMLRRNSERGVFQFEDGATHSLSSLNFDLTTSFIDDPIPHTSEGHAASDLTNTDFMASLNAGNLVDLNEIDFTDIFTKPAVQPQSQSQSQSQSQPPATMPQGRPTVASTNPLRSVYDTLDDCASSLLTPSLDDSKSILEANFMSGALYDEFMSANASTSEPPLPSTQRGDVLEQLLNPDGSPAGKDEPLPWLHEF
ncbi:DNA-binding transcription factor AFT1 KNAG_0F02010 [Huiozyma naganishii CBS 8797]|uniref:Uncharacterized protein n=1 Tax=Huiozyma naganishii (strain ATCC MYA-139 / BCRC 22969 / CBS 8797 / KCTC 17520 / NBRC 10181 / NCYC 3082 / Yp74L-3) TaxID=1071383 RepID=J7RMS2_HUIN7|nr:hypothetical protein KNAG_0F02010 [Kazachstania naganishii CBS 8797]CCK70868.1 hypothetical protein KNAG_0F02010 [Kazachstania naganishii CBS 8797]